MLYQLHSMDSLLSVTPGDLLATSSTAEPFTHILFQAAMEIQRMTHCVAD